ncbi:hypothetical protein [Mesorhizobium shonense]|uniref:hypothetical protein n=1 Tax=Mesorhizobium shonense TaxID=1209948 RepID=UPI00339A3C09
MRAFARNKSVIWTSKQEELGAKLVEQWAKDTAVDPNASQFVFAYTTGCRCPEQGSARGPETAR